MPPRTPANDGRLRAASGRTGMNHQAWLRVGLIGLAALTVAAAPARAAADAETRDWQWNAGLGLASLVYPSWRGADDSNSLVLPAPVFSIWTDNAELGRGGIRSQRALGERLFVRASISGSLPANSDDSPLREGLPDLDATLEAGPALVWFSPDFGAWHLRLEALLRGVFTVNFTSPQWLGLTFQPRASLVWSRGSAQSRTQWFGRIAAGPIWAEGKQHRYYYGVTPAQAENNALLQPFAAAGGYSGARINASLSWTRGKVAVSSYVGYDDLSHTAFADSPLRPKDSYWLAGAFVSWRFFGPVRPLNLED